MDDDGTVRLEPHEVALLRGGPRAAVTVAVVDLYMRGAVEAGPPGTVRALDAEPGIAARPLPPLAETVRWCLDEPLSIRRLTRQPDVRLAVALMRIPLAEAGMLRPPLLGPTRAARRRVRALRERHPPPAGRRGMTADDRLLAVALHDVAALRVLFPRFALRAGLVERVEVGGRGLLKHSPRGTGSGSTGGMAYYCGGGGGGGGSD
ncbi:TIGR04222 domain-containing membrane protein [Streptomyces sp. M92]|uniref:TIGR04222 domain-containing membrane protein n=1 Tax=Streptomyces sp. M92 TaxID=2944250 RepID=UPI00234AF7CD|nr:TIGR04222 domain-containing membrane protein [Streptomyces sp. M92]WCN03999.1 TIGR04222 domain-containing membrane protein [Streptomyces sp. M92]